MRKKALNKNIRVGRYRASQPLLQSFPLCVFSLQGVHDFFCLVPYIQTELGGTGPSNYRYLRNIGKFYKRGL